MILLNNNLETIISQTGLSGLIEIIISMAYRAQNEMMRRQWFLTSRTTPIEEAYSFQEELGTGSYGKVYRITSIETSVSYSVKIIQKSRVTDFKTFKREVKALANLDHPNIIKLIETYESDRLCYIVSEYCSGGEVFQRIVQERTLNEVSAAIIMRKLFSAIAYCHENNVCHRDLRPENVLFFSSDPESDIKLIDFGLAKSYTEGSVMHSLSGTPYYIAPEILNKNYTEQVDCWSLGVILYVMLGGTPPFKGKDTEEILLNVYDGTWSFRPKPFKQVSDLAKDLISRLLIKDPDIRITAREAFNHPWIQGLIPLPSPPLTYKLFANMENFTASQKLKKATLMFIASRFDERRIENIKQVFTGLDDDGDGMISRREFEEGLFRSHIHCHNDSLDEIWECIDANMNGRIDYTEFLTACMHQQQFADRGILKTAFQFFDLDNNGFISADEMRRVFKDNEVQLDIPDSKINEIMMEVDYNRDGHIDYQEFLQMMYG